MSSTILLLTPIRLDEAFGRKLNLNRQGRQRHLSASWRFFKILGLKRGLIELYTKEL